MSLIVLKFGGTSVRDTDAIKNVAKKVKREVERGNKVAVIVSAMAGVTNQLVSYCKEIDEHFDEREYDTIVSSGEQVTSGLLAMALQAEGVKARSWLGWQINMMTSEHHSRAKIKDIRLDSVRYALESGEVAVIAGFQGVDDEERITTLGRGGSDTSAVAVAAVLGADRCDIYTDVDGVYSADPRVVDGAKKIKKINYEAMLEMASAGAKVLQVRSVLLAMKEEVSLQVLSSFDDVIGSDFPGTLIVDESEIMEQEIITAVTHSANEAKIVLKGVPDEPGIAAKVFAPLAENSINVDMIIQNVSMESGKADITFTVVREDLVKSLDILDDVCQEIGDIELESSADVAKVSVIGVGMRSHAGVARKMFDNLSEKNINIQAIVSSEVKISVLISCEYVELAVRTLHEAYNLDYNG